jgi:hypothetical protein
MVIYEHPSIPSPNKRVSVVLWSRDAGRVITMPFRHHCGLEGNLQWPLSALCHFIFTLLVCKVYASLSQYSFLITLRSEPCFLFGWFGSTAFPAWYPPVLPFPPSRCPNHEAFTVLCPIILSTTWHSPLVNRDVTGLVVGCLPSVGKVGH